MPTVAGPQSVTVQAANRQGSATATFMITAGPDTTPPSAPFLSLGTITAVDSIPLSWTDSTDNVGVAGYRIFNYTPAVYKGHSGRDGGITLVSPAKYTLLVDGITGDTYTMTGLATNSTHRYAVAAFDAAGNQSAYSNVVVGTTLNPPSFTWSFGGATNPPLSVVADYPLTFYVYTTGSPAPTLSVVSAPDGVVYGPSQINWTPTAADVGTDYITMQAVNSVGSYTYAIPVTVTPDTPQMSLTINGGITYGAGQFSSGQSNYVVNVNPYFGSAANPQYGLSGTPFNFQVTSTSNAEPTTFALISGPSDMMLDPNTGAGSWTPTKADAGTTNVVIAATNQAGTSTLELTFPTYFTDAPGTPVANYYTSTSGVVSNNPTMSWAAPTDTTGLAGYLLTVTDAHTNAVTTFDTHSTDTSFTLSGLGGQQYFVTVTPYDSSGNVGMTSPTVSIYGLALTPVSWTLSAPSATLGTPFSVQFAPSNAGLSYSIASGPNGAVIDPNTGLLTWTPTDPGKASFTVAATSGWGTIDAVLNVQVYLSPTTMTLTSGPEILATATMLSSTTLSATVVSATLGPSPTFALASSTSVLAA
jgi:hypothetical protein